MTRWGKFGLSLCAVALIYCSSVNAGVSVSVFPAYAPNGQLSPNWGDYTDNAIAGIMAGGTATGAGDRNSNPAKYEPVMGVVDPSEMVFTPEFNSWRGAADPNTTFTTNVAVANEHGNRIHFGTHIAGTDGMQFSLHDVKWSLDSDDADDFFDQSGDFVGENYTSARIGIDFVDGIKGNGNDLVYDAGQSGALAVDELYYVGVGEGFLSENQAAINDQADIDLTLAAIFAGCDGCEVHLTGSYMVGDDSGSGRVTLFVPEPSSIVLVVAGLLGMLNVRRKW